MQTVASSSNRIAWLYTYTLELINSIISNFNYKTQHFVPTRIANQAAKNPEATVTRLEQAAGWLYALCSVFNGRTDYLKPLVTRPARPGQKPPTRTNTGPTTPKPDLTPEQRDQALHRTICRAFQTQSIGRIAYRVCRTLCIDRIHELFPANAVAITETPAEWSKRNYPDLKPPPKPLPASYWLRKLRRQQKQQAQILQTNPQPPPEPHKLE